MSARINRLAVGWVLVIVLAALCLASGMEASPRSIPRYVGRVLYRTNKKPAPGLLVELVAAEDDGKPTDEVLGSAHADAEGRFVVAMEKVANGPVAIVVSAVRESADSGGDRRSEGYEVRSERIRVGSLSNPSATKPNTILIERRRPGRGSEDQD